MRVQAVSTEGGLLSFPIEDVQVMSTRGGVRTGATYDGNPTHVLWWDENGGDIQPIPFAEAKEIFNKECEETSGFSEEENPRLIAWIKRSVTQEDIIQYLRLNNLGRWILLMNIIDRCPANDMRIILNQDSHSED